jgi:hypothetical protein
VLGVPLRAPRFTSRVKDSGFKIGHRLGCALVPGAYGRVLRAMQGKTLVAAKIVHDLSDAWREEGVPLEAALLQGLQHTGIVQLLDHKIARTTKGDEHLWLILEHCNKGTHSVTPPPPPFRPGTDQLSSAYEYSVLPDLPSIQALVGVI